MSQRRSRRAVTPRARTRPAPDWVIKVGGSLGARPVQLRCLMQSLAHAARRQLLLVVPGGGDFADAVRRTDRRFKLRDSAAHWMAILAMDQYSYLLADLAPGAALVRSRRELAPGRLNVLAPSIWLRRADPLPHSWDVTSDSIAAWVARALGTRRLMLVKDVDGFLARGREPGGRRELRRRVARDKLSDVVDRHFTRVLRPATTCWIVRGSRPARIARLLRTGRTHGTEVI